MVTAGLGRLSQVLLALDVGLSDAEYTFSRHIFQTRGDMVQASWGQQIRNYVFHPYKLVKDTRTGAETAQVQDVMDGNLDALIEAYLRHARGLVGAEKVGDGAEGAAVEVAD